MAKKNTIKLKKYVDIVNEYVAAEEILPGSLVTLNSDDEVELHATAGEVERMFALEDELQGRTIENAYQVGDPVQCWVATPGEEVYALLADGQDVAIGDHLQSAGDGTLAAVTTGTPIAVVIVEAVDLSASSNTTAGRVKVRML